MKPNKDDFFDSMDSDRDWIHTEVLGQGKKRANFVSNLTVILVLICTVLLLFIAFRDMTRKDDLSNLENMDKIAAEKQKESDLAKLKEEQKAKELADAEAAKKEAEGETLIYVVESGDTLASIGLEFGVDYKEIATANGIEEPYDLNIGQELKIPGVKKPAAETTIDTSNVVSETASGDTYTVESGDTLGLIASQFGTTYQALAELNGIEPPYELEVGQVLKIPSKQ